MKKTYDRFKNSELEEYQSEFLISELETRGFLVTEKNDLLYALINKIYQQRRCNDDYQKELDMLIELLIGRC